MESGSYATWINYNCNKNKLNIEENKEIEEGAEMKSARMKFYKQMSFR